MNRRQFLMGFGTLAASATLATATGAFSTTSAERRIFVETAQDSDAYLKLDALGAAERSKAGDLVEFEFPSLAEQVSGDVNPQNPQGLGVDSVYRFDSDVGGSDGLLRITNQGTQPVDVSAEQQTVEPDRPEVEMYDVETGDLLTPDNPYEGLGVGDQLRVGFQIDTRDVDVQNEAFDIILMINAVANQA